MENFTIRDIEHLTGIKAHTLRIWEQRYSFFQPKRKESQHRYYDNEDLRQLLKITLLYRQGWKLSRIASLDTEALNNAVESSHSPAHEAFVIRLLEAAISFDERLFRPVLTEIFRQFSFEEGVSLVCYPFLQRIGLLWTSGKVIPAQEHFSSHLIQSVIIAATDRLPLARLQPKCILFCPDKEYHEIPLLFAAYLFRKRGWSYIYLGQDVSEEMLEAVISLHSPQFLYFNLLTNLTGREPGEFIERLVAQYPRVRLLASGVSSAAPLPKTVTLMNSPAGLSEWLDDQM